MTGDSVICYLDHRVIEISRALDDHDVRGFPMIDDDGTPTGIVALDDLVATIGEHFDDVADTGEAQLPNHRS